MLILRIYTKCTLAAYLKLVGARWRHCSRSIPNYSLPRRLSSGQEGRAAFFLNSFVTCLVSSQITTSHFSEEGLCSTQHTRDTLLSTPIYQTSTASSSTLT